ncbi:hypothetical protein AB0280_17685 [Pseudarthrobacter sp902506025]|uniref:hypothetical protein n=1 Tax=Pseudarthrobacter sp. 902506025 TaxID=3155291 RepID=UPI003450C6D4
MKAAAKNKELHGEDFYAKIGAKGGRNGTSGGFAAKTECNCNDLVGSHHKAMCAGKKGGQISRRPKDIKVGDA